MFDNNNTENYKMKNLVDISAMVTQSLNFFDIKDKIIEKMLECNLVHFLGSDAHRTNSIYTKINLAVRKIKDIVGQDEFDKISHFNAMSAVKNEEIEIENPNQIKLTLKDKMKMSLK